MDKLYVVSVISNPVRYRSRYALYRAFEKQVLDAGAHLVTVELALGDRPFEITSAENPNHIQLRSWHELWHKEGMIRAGVARMDRIDPQWQYVAWIDADVQFSRPDWVTETVQQLQHYHMVQMFSHAQDLGPDYQPIQMHRGFAFSYLNGLKAGGDRYEAWHPGYAWAISREAWDMVGGVIDTAILGSADKHMAMSLIGRVEMSYAPGLSAGYKEILHRWQDLAVHHLKGDIGYIPGVINHYWHGKKRQRFYRERWQILVDNGFDPALDLKRDWQGLWQLTDRNPRLRDDIRQYLRSRNEDSIDIE